MSTSLTTLSADHVDTELDTLRHVLWVTDHVHVKDAGLVDLLDNVLWWDSDSADKESGTRVDDNVNQVIEFAFRVVVAVAVVSPK